MLIVYACARLAPRLILHANALLAATLLAASLFAATLPADWSC